MKLNITFPPQVVENLSKLLSRPDGDLSVHIGSLGGSARVCVEYSVALAGRDSATTVMLMYAVGEADITKTQMYQLKEPMQLQSWFDSLDRETLLQTAVSLDFSTEARGFVLNIDSGEGVTTPATILTASRMTKYAIPATLPYVDPDFDAELNNGQRVMFDGERYAGYTMALSEGSILLVDVEDDPLNRKSLASTLKTIARIDMEGPDVFVIPPSDSRPKSNAKPKSKASPKPREVDPGNAGLVASDVEEVVVPSTPQSPVPPTPPQPPAAQTPPSMIEAPEKPAIGPKDEVPEKAESASDDPEKSEPGDSRETVAPERDQAENSDTVDVSEDSKQVEDPRDPGDSDDDKPAPKQRRSSADIDNQAVKRLEERGFAVLPRVEGLFDTVNSAAAIETYRSKRVTLSEYDAALRIAFLDRLAEVTDKAEAADSLKAKFQAMINQL